MGIGGIGKNREEERVKIRMKVGWTVAKVNFGYMTGNLFLTPQSVQVMTSLDFLVAVEMHTPQRVWPHFSRNGSLFGCRAFSSFTKACL